MADRDCVHGQLARVCDYCELEAEIAGLQRAWIESAGHRPDCRSRLCACGSDWCGEGTYRNGHYFKFGPCDCGYSELTEN